MEIVIKLSQFLLSLSLLIILHELGHFIPAKIFKTRVEKFYLFFDAKFSLVKKKIGETEYGIGWLPLGGYVKIAGMIDESMDKEQMNLPPQPWEFRSKPTWQRLIIMLGGVTVNFILAFVIYIGMSYAYGDQFIYTKDVKDGIWVANPVVEKTGLKTGDKIISINGTPAAEKFENINEELQVAKHIVVERDGQQKTIDLPQDFIGQLLEGERASIVELRVPFVVTGVQDDSPNKDKVKPKDIITVFNGQTVQYADQVLASVDTLKGKTVQAVVLRDGKKIPLNLIVSDSSKMGIQFGGRLAYDNLEKLGIYKINRQKYGFGESFPVGMEKGKERLVKYSQQLKAIFTPSTGAYAGVGGFYAIFNVFPDQWSWEVFWSITALLSIMLGVMNLLPIPALDGGHVMFLLYEMITRRKPSDKFMEYAQITGFVLLIALVLFANGNDIYRAITRK
ncbi:MAG TPA: RIP metalloprotease RseP [Flavobacterium sp.]|nr:RIP metalloprotease RseP [Flavobacterium sp.]